MDDVIFYGSASRKPVGLAEVELRFSNDGVLAVPWSEIAVARRLYRTGESEYLLNKQPTRLRDILDLFAGTGANPRAYSVMDQDKLNHVLTAKPHERRVFIEEAAGIARYKQQRSETQGKLDGARGNLVRVKDRSAETVPSCWPPPISPDSWPRPTAWSSRSLSTMSAKRFSARR